MSHDFDVVTGPTAVPPLKTERAKPPEAAPQGDRSADKMAAIPRERPSQP